MIFMANKVGVLEYTKRIGRSIAYGAFDAIKETMPMSTALVMNNQEALKQAYSDIVGSKAQLNKIKEYGNSYIFKPAETMLNNLKKDLKSGNFYHPDRAAQMEKQAGNDMMKKILEEEGLGDLMALLEGEDEISEAEMSELPVTPRAEITRGDTVVANALTREQRRATHAIVDANTKLAEAGIQTQRAVGNLQFRQMQRNASIMHEGFESVIQGFNNLNRFNNEVLLEHAKNSQKYYETMTKLTMENNAILKEMIEMKRNLYKKQSGEESEKKPNAFSNGIFDLKGYIDIVNQNMKESIFGGIGLFISGIPAMISSIVSNPLHFASKQLTKGFLGPLLRKSMKDFDRTINGFIHTALLRMGNYANEPGSGILGELAGLFGIKTEKMAARNVNIAGALKGPRQWDAEDHFALTKVITSHLSNIEAELTGQSARVFDSSTGKWTTQSAMKERFRREEQSQADANTAELQSLLKTGLMQQLSINPETDAAAVRELNQTIKDFALGMQRAGGLGTRAGGLDIILENKNNVFGANQNYLRLIHDFLQAAMADDSKNKMRYRGAVYSANSNIAQSMIDESNRRKSGNLTSLEEMVATNADLNASQLNEYQKTLFDLQKAKEYNDREMIRALTDKLDSFGAESAADRPSPIGGTIDKAMGTDLLTWQSKIYDVLCQIRDSSAISHAGLGHGPIGTPPTTGSGLLGGTVVHPVSPTASIILPSSAANLHNTQSPIQQQAMDIRLDANGNYVWNEDWEALAYSLIGRSRGTAQTPSQSDLRRIATDSDYAKQFGQRMQENVKTTSNIGHTNDLYYENGIVDDVLGSNRSDEDLNAKLTEHEINPNEDVLMQLAKASTLGAKYAVISANLNKLLNSPRTMLTSVMSTADNLMYELIFGKDIGEVDENGQPIHGFFGKMMSEMSKAGQVLSDKISDVAKSIYDNKDKWLESGKTLLKNWFGLDVNKLGNSISSIWQSAKEGGKSLFDDITGAVKGTFQDMGVISPDQPESQQQQSTAEGQQQTPNIETRAFGQYPAIVSKGEAVIHPDGTGSKNISKSGLTTLTRNSTVIPSNMNPWNPNRSSADPLKDLNNENRIRNRITAKLASPGGAEYAKSLPGFASGKQAVQYALQNIDPAELEKVLLPITAIMESKGISQDEALSLLGDYASDTGGNLSDSDQSMAKEVVENIWKSKSLRKNKVIHEFFGKILRKAGYKGDLKSEDELKYDDYSNDGGPMNFAKAFMMQATGKDPEKALEETKKYIIHNTPEIMKGGAAGALIGAVFPLGGPLLGAVAGAAAQVLGNNKTFMNYVFGTEVVDAEGNKTRQEDGLISAKFMKSLEKYIPDAKKYGITGSLIGLVAPFGPLGGLMAGVAASYIKNNEAANNFLFGDSSGLLLNKDRKAAIKKALPNISAAMLGTFFLGPFGLLGNAALGAGLGMLSTTELFKKAMLGAKDKNGVRHGGLAGAIKRHITNPLQATMKEMKRDFKKWFRDDVTKPLGKGLKPIAKEIKNQLKKGASSIMDIIQDTLNSTGNTFIERALDTIGGIRKAGGLGKFLVQKAVGGTVGLAVKGVEKLGNKIRRKQFSNFEVHDENKDAADLMRELQERGMQDNRIATYLRNLYNMTDTDLKSFTESTDLMSSLYDKNLERNIKSQNANALGNVSSTVARVAENPLYTDSTRGFVRNILSEVEKFKDAKDETQAKEMMENVIDRLNKVTGLESKDYNDIVEAVKEAGQTMAATTKKRNFVKDPNNSAVISRNIKTVMDMTGLSEEEAIKFMPNIAKMAANQYRLKTEGKVSNNTEAVDEASKEAKVDETVTENTSAVQSNTNALRALCMILNGQDPGDINKLLASDTDFARDAANVQRDIVSKWLRVGQARGEDVRNASRDEMFRKAQEMQVFDTVNGINKDNFFRVFGNTKNNANNKYAEGFMTLANAKGEGNKALVQDFEKILQTDSSGDGTLFRRIAVLTALGLNIDPKYYSTIDEWGEVEYNTAVQLANLGVKFSDFREFSKIAASNNSEVMSKSIIDFAKVMIENENGQLEGIADKLVADEMINIFAGNGEFSKAVQDNYYANGNFNHIQALASGKYKDAFNSSIDQSLTTGGYEAGMYGKYDTITKPVTKNAVESMTGNRTGRLQSLKRGIIGAGKLVGKMATGTADLAGRAVDKVVGKVFDNTPYANLKKLWKYIDAANGPGGDEFKEAVKNEVMNNLITNVGYDLADDAFGILGTKAKDIAEFIMNDPTSLPKVIDIFQAYRDGRIDPAQMGYLFDLLLNGHDIDTSDSGLDALGVTGNGGAPSQLSSPPASPEQISQAAALPAHAGGIIAAGGRLLSKAGGLVKAGWGKAKGLGSKALTFLGVDSALDLFGGSDDKKEDSEEETAQKDSSGGSGGDIAGSSGGGSGLMAALGAASGFVGSGNQVIGGGGMAPLERGQSMIIPTAYGPKLFTTSSVDGGMMEAHNRDNSEVDAKEQADISRKERVVSALEKIAEKSGSAGKELKKLSSKGGLLGALAGLATLPLTMVGGLVSALGGIPFIGPIIGAVAAPLALKLGGAFKSLFGNAAGAEAAAAERALTETAAQATKNTAGKAGFKGMLKAISKVLPKAAVIGIGAVLGYLGYDILSDDDKDNDSSDTSDRDEHHGGGGGNVAKVFNIDDIDGAKDKFGKLTEYEQKMADNFKKQGRSDEEIVEWLGHSRAANGGNKVQIQNPEGKSSGWSIGSVLAGIPVLGGLSYGAYKAYQHGKQFFTGSAASAGSGAAEAASTAAKGASAEVAALRNRATYYAQQAAKATTPAAKEKALEMAKHFATEATKLESGAAGKVATTAAQTAERAIAGEGAGLLGKISGALGTKGKLAAGALGGLGISSALSDENSEGGGLTGALKWMAGNYAGSTLAEGLVKSIGGGQYAQMAARILGGAGGSGLATGGFGIGDVVANTVGEAIAPYASKAKDFIKGTLGMRTAEAAAAQTAEQAAESAAKNGGAISKGMDFIRDKTKDLLNSDTAKNLTEKAGKTFSDLRSSDSTIAENAGKTLSGYKDQAKSLLSDAAKQVGQFKDKAVDSISNTKLNPAEIAQKAEEVLMTVKNNIAKYVPGGSKIMPFMEKAAVHVLELVKSPKALAEIAKKLTKQTLMGIPVLGLVITAAFVAEGVYSGIKNAEEILDIPPGTATTGMKCFAAAVGALQGAPIIGLIPSKWIVDLLMGFCDLLGFGAEDLRQLRKAKKDQEKADKATESDAIQQKAMDNINKVQMNMHDNNTWQKKVTEDVRKTTKDVGKQGAATSDQDKKEKTGPDSGTKEDDKSKITEEDKKALEANKPDPSKVNKPGYDEKGRPKQGILNAIRRTDTGTWLSNKADEAYNYFFGNGKFGRGKGDRPVERQDRGPLANYRFNIPGDTEHQTVADSACLPYSLENAFNGIEGPDPTGRRAYDLVQGSLAMKGNDDGVHPAYTHIAARLRGYNTENVTDKYGFLKSLRRGDKVIGMGQTMGRGSSPWGPGMHYEQFEQGSSPNMVKVYDPQESEAKEYPVDSVVDGMQNAVAIGRGKRKYGRAHEDGIDGILRDATNNILNNSPLGSLFRGYYGQDFEFFKKYTPETNQQQQNQANYQNNGVPTGGTTGGTTGGQTSGPAIQGIIETNLQFDNSKMQQRSATNRIIIHHTGEGDDPSAQEIHGWHKNNGWAGIGYHFVIRKNGNIERGRPENMIGSHAQGSNSDSIGIHVGGNFEKVEPTQSQIDSLIALIRQICQRYNIPIDRQHIIGHREVNSTACPGANLYKQLDDIVAKAAGAGRGKYGRSKFDSEFTGPDYKSKENKKSRIKSGRGKFGRGFFGREKSTGDPKQIWDYMKSKGLSNIAAAGIMGNLSQESGFYSDRVEHRSPENGSDVMEVDGDTGYGLAQWTYITRQQALKDYMSSRGLQDSDYKGQLDFMLDGHDRPISGVIQRMDQSGDAAKAADIWEAEYEGSDDRNSNPEGLQHRMDAAADFFKTEGKGSNDGPSQLSGGASASSAGNSSKSSGGSSSSNGLDPTSFYGKIGAAMDKMFNGTKLGAIYQSVLGSKFSFSNLLGGTAEASSGNKSGNNSGTSAKDENHGGGGGSFAPTADGKVVDAPASGSAQESILNMLGGPPVTSPYGEVRGSRKHAGIDIGVDEGTEVPTPVDGILDYGSESGYGNWVTVTDANGCYHIFGHNSKNDLIEKGAKVKAGTIIALAGNTGQSFGAHIHYGIYPPDNSACTGWTDIDPGQYQIQGLATSSGKGKYGRGVKAKVTGFNHSGKDFDGGKVSDGNNRYGRCGLSKFGRGKRSGKYGRNIVAEVAKGMASYTMKNNIAEAVGGVVEKVADVANRVSTFTGPVGAYSWAIQEAADKSGLFDSDEERYQKQVDAGFGTGKRRYGRGNDDPEVWMNDFKIANTMQFPKLRSTDATSKEDAKGFGRSKSTTSGKSSFVSEEDAERIGKKNTDKPKKKKRGIGRFFEKLFGSLVGLTPNEEAKEMIGEEQTADAGGTDANVDKPKKKKRNIFTSLLGGFQKLGAKLGSLFNIGKSVEKATKMAEQSNSNTKDSSINAATPSATQAEGDTAQTTINAANQAKQKQVADAIRTESRYSSTNSDANFKELLAEQKKTNDLLEGILKAITQNGETMATVAKTAATNGGSSTDGNFARVMKQMVTGSGSANLSENTHVPSMMNSLYNLAAPR